MSKKLECLEEICNLLDESPSNDVRLAFLSLYMKVFCKNGREISESTFAVYYPWLNRALQKAGGGHIEPNVKVFTNDIEQMKKEVEVFYPDDESSTDKVEEDTPYQKFIIELKAEARRYCNENFANPTESDYLLIEKAMILGSELSLKAFGSTPSA
jgi:hypothetical protein